MCITLNTGTFQLVLMKLFSVVMLCIANVVLLKCSTQLYVVCYLVV